MPPLRVNPLQLRRLLRLGVMLRWVAICFAGLAGLMAVKPPEALFYLILAAATYTAGIMFAISQVTDAGAQRLALAVTLIDQFFAYTFMTIVSTAIPQGGQVAFYFFCLIEAVAYFDAVGAVLSVTSFIVLSAIDASIQVLVGAGYSLTGGIGKTLIVALGASALVAVNRILLAPVDPRELAPEFRLSRREQEVLRLVAEGYSNAMIATRLNLRENTVKSYVENLLARLNARNRAEAVAAASRLKLI